MGGAKFQRIEALSMGVRFRRIIGIVACQDSFPKATCLLCDVWEVVRLSSQRGGK